jgi:hypothetical protein
LTVPSNEVLLQETAAFPANSPVLEALVGLMLAESEKTNEGNVDYAQYNLKYRIVPGI